MWYSANISVIINIQFRTQEKNCIELGLVSIAVAVIKKSWNNIDGF